MSTKYQSRKDQMVLISEESAREQIIAMLDHYDINIESLADGNESGARAMEKALDQLTSYVMRGVLEITVTEKGLVATHTLTNGQTVVYGEVNAKAKLAAEKFPTDNSYSRVYAFMGSLCGLGKSAIEKMSPRDLSVVEVLGTVFLNA